MTRRSRACIAAMLECVVRRQISIVCRRRDEVLTSLRNRAAVLGVARLKFEWQLLEAVLDYGELAAPEVAGLRCWLSPPLQQLRESLHRLVSRAARYAEGANASLGLIRQFHALTLMLAVRDNALRNRRARVGGSQDTLRITDGGDYENLVR